MTIKPYLRSLVLIIAFLVLSTDAVDVDHRVIRVLDDKGTCNVLVLLKEKPHLARLGNESSGLLQDMATENQQEFVAHFRTSKGLQVRPFWIDSYVAVDDVTPELLEEMKARKDVLRVYSNELSEPRPDVKLSPSSYENDGGRRHLGSAPIDPSIATPARFSTSADCLHDLGFTGQTIVVGISSTGVALEHEALLPPYRGYDKKTGIVNHNYNWYDGFLNYRAPRDVLYIGSHITGIAVGAKNGIGVAPGAKFISCRSIDDFGRDTPESYIRCMQFFLAPHDLDGQNADPGKRPHIVFIPISSSTETDAFSVLIDTLKTAGILVVTEAANRNDPEDPFCAKQVKSPSYYPNILTIGGIKRDGSLSNASTGGPVFLSNGSIDTSRVKPDFCALGQSVESSVFISGQALYLNATGNAISATAVAGAVAVLWSAIPGLKRNVATTTELLLRTANQKPTTDCSSPAGYPNNVFGYGQINVARAYDKVQKKTKGLKPLSKGCKKRT